MISPSALEHLLSCGQRYTVKVPCGIFFSTNIVHYIHVYQLAAFCSEPLWRHYYAPFMCYFCQLSNSGTVWNQIILIHYFTDKLKTKTKDPMQVNYILNMCFYEFAYYVNGKLPLMFSIRLWLSASPRLAWRLFSKLVGCDKKNP